MSDAAASCAGLVGPVGVTAPLGAGAAPEETPEEMPEGGPGADRGTAR